MAATTAIIDPFRFHAPSPACSHRAERWARAGDGGIAVRAATRAARGPRAAPAAPPRLDPVPRRGTRGAGKRRVPPRGSRLPLDHPGRSGGWRVGRGVAAGGIGVLPPPGEDRGAIDDEVARADQPQPQRLAHREDEEPLERRRAGGRGPLPPLARARHARPAVLPNRQSARHGEGRPVAQPVAHIFVGQAPQGAQ